ncbi:MAG: DUF2157 domain-containing protein [Deltaproteobacteria bacterium]|nr:MAG: DUF2157 domain-containing protein [Deltaproteobacteria bacterium]
MSEQQPAMPSGTLEGAEISSSQLQDLYASGKLSGAAYRRAMVLVEERPTPEQWYDFVLQFFLFAGAALFLAGVVFFFAYNWYGLHRFAKLGIIEGGILGTALLAWYLGLDRLSGQVSLLVSAILIGPLLAVFGQIYQTGADPYELFMGWALLAIGWTLVSRFSVLWIVWLLIVNFAITLFCLQVLNWRTGQLSIQMVLAAFNLGALVVWEFFARRGVDWLQTSGQWAQRSLFTAALIFLSSGAWIGVVSRRVPYYASSKMYAIAVVLYLLFVAAAFAYFRYIRIDLYPLSALILSIIVIDTSYLGRVLKFETAVLFLLSALVIAQAAAGVYWLRSLDAPPEAL